MLSSFVKRGAVYLSCSPVDMRKSINGLAAIVQGTFELDPFEGALFVFVNNSKDKIKVLKWDRDGFCLYYKRREKGRFVWPEKLSGNTVQIRRSDLERLLSGLIMEAFVPHKDYTVL